MAMRRRILLLTLVLCLVFSVTACGPSNDDQNDDQKTSSDQESVQEEVPDELVIAMSGEILTLDTQVAQGTPSEVARMHMYECLIEQDDDGNFQPALAESWETSDDNTEWTFHLRKGVKFHDGSEMTAKDVERTFNRLLNREYGSSRINDFIDLVAVEVIDDYTVKFITDGPVGNLLNLLAYGGGAIVSADAIDTYKEDLSNTVVGTGPYKLEEFEAADHVTMVANEDYYGDVPKIKKLIFKTVEEPSTRVNMILTGEAGFATDIEAQDIETINDSGKASIRQDESNRVAQIGFNINKEPFNNKKVRQALNYAVDKNSIVSGVLGGAAKVTNNVVATNVFGYIDGKFEYNPEKAKELLAEVGYPDGFSAKLWTPQGRYFKDKETALAIANQLAEVGVNLDVEVHDWATYLEELKVAEEDGNEVEAYLLGWECYTREAGYTIQTLFTEANIAPAGWNTMFYSNPEVEVLNQKIRTEVDKDKRKADIEEALSIISDDAVWIPLYAYNQISAEDNRLKGVYILPTQLPKFEKAYFE